MPPGLAGSALLLAGASAVAFCHLRHWGLFLRAMVAPLPGVVLGGALVLWLAPEALPLLGLCWLFGLAIALLRADGVALAGLQGAGWREAWRADDRRSLWVFLILPLAVALCALLLLTVPGEGASGTGAAILALSAAVSAAMPLPLPLRLSLNEDYAIRANRMRERAQLVQDRLISVARPRWGFAVAGIWLIFAALGAFGVEGLAVPPTLADMGLIWPAVSVVILSVAIALAIRDWRWILATLVALWLAVLIGLWGLALAETGMDGSSIAGFLLAAEAAAVPLFAFGIEAGQLGREGEEATLATARVLSRRGFGLFFVGAALTAGLLAASLVWGQEGLALAAMAAFATAGPFLFQPAMAGVIEHLLPRPETIAARYRLS